jgi:hypothetical protein
MLAQFPLSQSNLIKLRDVKGLPSRHTMELTSGRWCTIDRSGPGFHRGWRTRAPPLERFSPIRVQVVAPDAPPQFIVRSSWLQVAFIADA